MRSCDDDYLTKLREGDIISLAEPTGSNKKENVMSDVRVDRGVEQYFIKEMPENNSG